MGIGARNWAGLGPVPQFAVKRACSHCPFRVGNDLGALGTRTATRVADDIDHDAPFACHKTTTDKGRGLSHPQARYCAGAIAYSLSRAEAGTAELPTFIALGMELGIFDPEQIERGGLLDTRAEFLAYHVQDGE